MAVWPGTLPQTLMLPLNRKRQAGKIRSQVDAGPAKQRARYTAVAKDFDAILVLTGAELAIFDNFYETMLGQGAASFTWVDPVTDTAATLRFRAEPEDSLVAAHDDPDKRLYNVTMPLELMP